MRIARVVGAAFLAVFSAVLLVATSAGAAPAAVWSSSARYATWSNGGYTIYNDVWSSHAGPQTIYANSGTNWWVNSNQPHTGGVKAYPNSTKSVNRSLSSLRSVSSSVNFSTPSDGVYDAAYDIWDTNHRYETMVWLNWRGAGPIGGQVATANIGGATWAIHKGSNGSNAVFSFLRTSQTKSSTVDVLAVLKWIESRGWFGNITLGQVQFGFEITSTNGTETYKVNSYSVSSS